MQGKERKLIYDFLYSHPMATIATIDAHTAKPESALIAFAEFDDLRIMFETFHDTRKYQNLKANDHVALVVGWDQQKHITLQYEGKAREVTGEEAEKCRSMFQQKDTPCSDEFLLHPKVRLFVVSPTWLAYADYIGKHPYIIEHHFNDQA